MRGKLGHLPIVPTTAEEKCSHRSWIRRILIGRRFPYVNWQSHIADKLIHFLTRRLEELAVAIKRECTGLAFARKFHD
jgi:hypothetical protein